jgi:3-oxoacyl-[acyl-carrier protein] reductase
LERKPFFDMSAQEWDKVMSVNLKGPFLCVKAVYPYMKDQRYGKIVNISSNTVMSGGEGRCHYMTSKAGVIGLTRALSKELGEYNITVNAVAPGITESERYHPSEATLSNRRAARSIKRNQSPEDLIGTVLFLASSASDFVTGQTIVVDGGQMFI